MTHVVIVNGRPRAGKDTLIDMLTTHLSVQGRAVESFSSIDPIRDMLNNAGIDTSEKTPDDRKLLARIGDAVEEHSRFRSQECTLRVLRFTRAHGGNGVFFLHVREPEIIERIRGNVAMTKIGRELPVRFTTVLVRSHRSPEFASNAADAGVETMRYDWTIGNDGTLEDLDVAAQVLITNALQRPC